MKKWIISAALIAWLAVPAHAQRVQVTLEQFCSAQATYVRYAATQRDVGADQDRTYLAIRQELPVNTWGNLASVVRGVWEHRHISPDQMLVNWYTHCMTVNAINR